MQQSERYPYSSATDRLTRAAEQPAGRGSDDTQV